jgi:glycolate oxidase
MSPLLYLYALVDEEPRGPLGEGIAGEPLRLIRRDGIAAVAGELDVERAAMGESWGRLEALREKVAALGFRPEALAAALAERTRLQAAADAAARARLWAARKGAASAMGRIAPNYYLHDAVVPRTRLPRILAQVVEIGQRYELPIANLFHAGDGNLHPMILFDVRQPGILDRVMAAGREILTRCIEAGGTITGEHGVGLEKQAFMPLIFSPADLDVMGRVRSAIDPTGNFNPAKVLPTADPGHAVTTRSHAQQRIPEGMWV